MSGRTNPNFGTKVSASICQEKSYRSLNSEKADIEGCWRWYQFCSKEDVSLDERVEFQSRVSNWLSGHRPQCSHRRERRSSSLWLPCRRIWCLSNKPQLRASICVRVQLYIRKRQHFRSIRLDPASDAEARLAQDDWASERSYPDALRGQAKDLAVENTQSSYKTSGASSNTSTAPSYVNSQYADRGGPKGQNLTEGIEGTPKNASFNQDIGGRNDPGRLAEEKFQRQNADGSYNAAMPRQQGTTGDNTYDTLGGDTSA